MFVLCVLYSKDTRQSQDEEDKEVQIKYREQKKNPTWGLYVCILWVLYGVRYRSLRQADPSSRGVLPIVVCHCVV
jgi:hypothetical protein